jgi:hypothetical protein
MTGESADSPTGWASLSNVVPWASKMRVVDIRKVYTSPLDFQAALMYILRVFRLPPVTP